jgi:predicted CXXCH cytochrome family protein
LTCTEDPAADGDNLCGTRSSLVASILPVASACTSCHDSPDARAHAEIMTTASGAESCSTCHGTGRDLDVEVVHAPPP